MEDVMYVNLFEFEKDGAFVIIREGYTKGKVYRRRGRFTENCWRKTMWLDVSINDNGRLSNFKIPRFLFKDQQAIKNLLNSIL